MIKQAGSNLVEIAVALFLATTGAMGFLTLLIQAQNTELETAQYQVATQLLVTIASQIQANHTVPECYGLAQQVPAIPFVGTEYDMTGGYTCTVGGTLQTRQQAEQDIEIWHSLLIDGLINARGCISHDINTNQLTVAIAWQGILSSGTSTSNCGAGEYAVDTNGHDTLRRAISMTVSIPNLD